MCVTVCVWSTVGINKSIKLFDDSLANCFCIFLKNGVGRVPSFDDGKDRMITDESKTI